MSVIKYKKLLGKINLFHKLSHYGDRSSFLQRIAQMDPGRSYAIYEQTKENINAAAYLLSKINDPSLNTFVGSLQNIANNELNPSKVRQAYETALAAERLVVKTSPTSPTTKELATYVQAIYNSLMQLNEIKDANLPPENTNGEYTVEVEEPDFEIDQDVKTLPETTIYGDKPKTVAKVDKRVQQYLNSISDRLGLPEKLDVDGILGPKTQAALDAYKKLKSVDEISNEKEKSQVAGNE